MRVLLDENFQTDFAKHLSAHQVNTVHSLEKQLILLASSIDAAIQMATAGTVTKAGLT